MNNIRYTLSASTLKKDPVVDPDYNKLGSIKEIMLNLSTGKIDYFVLSFGGLGGIGDKLFAIPYERFTVDEKNKVIILDIDKQQLQDAPGFDKNNWPDFNDMVWNEKVVTYFNSSSDTRRL